MEKYRFSCFKNIILPARTYYTAHGSLLGVMCQRGWEGGLGKNGCMDTCCSVPSLFTWNAHSLLYSDQCKTRNSKFGEKKNIIRINAEIVQYQKWLWLYANETLFMDVKIWISCNFHVSCKFFSFDFFKLFKKIQQNCFLYFIFAMPVFSSSLILWGSLLISSWYLLPLFTVAIPNMFHLFHAPYYTSTLFILAYISPSK